MLLRTDRAADRCWALFCKRYQLHHHYRRTIMQPCIGCMLGMGLGSDLHLSICCLLGLQTSLHCCHQHLHHQKWGRRDPAPQTDEHDCSTAQVTQPLADIERICGLIMSPDCFAFCYPCFACLLVRLLQMSVRHRKAGPSWQIGHQD